MQFFNRVMMVVIAMTMLVSVVVADAPKVIIPGTQGDIEISMEEMVTARMGALNRFTGIGQTPSLDPSATLARLSIGIVDYLHSCGLQQTSMTTEAADQIEWKSPLILPEMFKELQAICRNIVVNNREVVSTTPDDILPFSISFGTTGWWRPRFFDYFIGSLSPTFYGGIWDSKSVETPLEFISRPSEPQCRPIITYNTENNQFVGNITCDIVVWSKMWTIPRGAPDFCRQTPEKAYCDGNILSIEPAARDEFTTSWKGSITTRIIIDQEGNIVLIPEKFGWFPLRTQYRRK